VVFQFRRLLIHQYIHSPMYPFANIHIRRNIFRQNNRLPFMAPLLRERVNIERSFARTGVDFCGPILIYSGIRRVVSVNCYIAFFICFVIFAVHLELVNSLTSDTCSASLTRFMARRGHLQ